MANLSVLTFQHSYLESKATGFQVTISCPNQQILKLRDKIPEEISKLCEFVPSRGAPPRGFVIRFLHGKESPEAIQSIKQFFEDLKVLELKREADNKATPFTEPRSNPNTTSVFIDDGLDD